MTQDRIKKHFYISPLSFDNLMMVMILKRRERKMQRFRKFMYNWVDHRMIFKHSNGISRPTVFEVRMRQIDLAVDYTMAVVFCAPKHNRICFITHDRIRQYFYNFPGYLIKFLSTIKSHSLPVHYSSFPS